jgi:hypothetical protein
MFSDTSLSNVLSVFHLLQHLTFFSTKADNNMVYSKATRLTIYWGSDSPVTVRVSVSPEIESTSISCVHTWLHVNWFCILQGNAQLLNEWFKDRKKAMKGKRVRNQRPLNRSLSINSLLRGKSMSSFICINHRLHGFCSQKAFEKIKA